MVTQYQPTPENIIAPRVYKTPLPGLLYLEHTKQVDERGFFKEISLIPDLNQVLPEAFNIKQISQAHSEKNVIRGFHAESWNKLIWLAQGQAYCVLVDLRTDSDTFGQAVSFLLGGEDGLLGGLFIPKGLANSVCVTQSPVDYLYCVDALYRDRDTSHDQAISLFDPDINVQWPIQKEDLVISPRDQSAITLRERFPEKFQ